MAQKKTHRRIPLWRQETGPALSLMREGGRLRVDFLYSPERVKAIKGITGYRFHAEDKSWSVPFEALAQLTELKEFPATRTLNGVAQVECSPVSAREAQAIAKKNPFCVPEAAISALSYELLVRLNAEKRRLKIIPRVGSRALKLLQRSKGALFSAYEQCFSLPAQSLPLLLKQMRDHQITFAIDAEAGTALADSAAARQELLNSPSQRHSNALAGALLTPFITRQGDDTLAGSYRPCFFTTEQFRLAFPGVNRKGASKPFELDDIGLLGFAARRETLPFPVWFTTEVEQRLKEQRGSLRAQFDLHQGELDDTLAEVLQLPVVWRVFASGRGGIAINLPPSDGFRVVIVSALSTLLGATYDDAADALTIEVPDSNLTQCVLEVEHALTVIDAAPAPKAKAFIALERDVQSRTEERTRCAFYTTLEDVQPEQIPALALPAARRLFPHQRVAIEWLRQTPHAFLGDDMGLGKTLSVLSYFEVLRAEQGFELLLVICPNSLTRNWAREAGQWFEHLRALTLTGDREEKEWALRLLTSGSVDYQVLIVNYEGVRLPYITPELERLTSEKKTLLCLDESQRVKNPTSKTFKALSSVAPKADRRVFLSGTPTPKDVTDLWAQMRLLDGGKRFGKSYYKWLASIAELGNEFSEFAVKSFNEEAVKETVLRAHEVMLRRRKERVVNLPEKTFIIREVPLSGNQKERYDEVREGLMLRMRAASGEQFVREITNILEEYLRAVQIASNPRLVDPEWKGEPAKFLELDELVHEIVREEGQKMVIWTNYLGNVRELALRYSDLGAAQFSGEVSAAEREATVRAFQESDSPKILIAVPAAGGVGITLTAAQTAVYIDKTWNAEHWLQSVDRIHRIGQKGTVNIISLLSCKVDEIIHWNLRRKERLQAQILGDTRDPEDFRSLPTREELLAALEIG